MILAPNREGAARKHKGAAYGRGAEEKKDREHGFYLSKR